jgi:hypothetical protein
MKTAMQELIERIEKQMSAISDDPNLTERALYDSYFNCKNWAIELLVKEKEQIIDAYYGNIDGVYGYREAGKEYYNQTYNQNK